MAPCSVCPGPRLKQARELTALTGMPKNLFTLDHRKEKGIPPSRLKDQSILQVPASSLRCCSGTCRLAKLLRTKSQAGRGFCAQFATCDNLPAVAGQRAHATKEHGNGCKEHRPQSVVVLAGKQEFVEAFSTIHQVSTWNAHQHNASSTMAIASLHKRGALFAHQNKLPQASWLPGGHPAPIMVCSSWQCAASTNGTGLSACCCL